METPFNMMIVGMTNCGKTTYLLNFLETEYKNHFDYVFLICPTFTRNKTYRVWKYVDDPDFFTIACDHDEVERYLKYVTNFAEDTNSLIILDDCANSQSVKKRTSYLVRLGFSARHYGLSTIVITQQLTSIAKPYRDNIRKITTFYNTDSDDMDVIFRKYMPKINLKEKEQIISTLKDKKYSRLEIMLDYPYTHELVVP